MPTMPSTLASAESKRAANRVAQRKFRRQHKDYVARLERELELSRAGASEELRHHQQEIKRLKDQQLKFRRLLDSVIKNMQKIIGDDEDLEMYEGHRSVECIPENGVPNSQMPCCDNSRTAQAHRSHMFTRTSNAEQDAAKFEPTATALTTAVCTNCVPGDCATSTTGIESMSAQYSPESGGCSTNGLEDVETTTYRPPELDDLATIEQTPVGIVPESNLPGYTPLHLGKSGVCNAGETITFLPSIHLGNPTGATASEHIGQIDLRVYENHTFPIDTAEVESINFEDNSPIHSNLTRMLSLDKMPQFQHRVRENMQFKPHHSRYSQLSSSTSRITSVVVRTSLVPVVFYRRVSDFLDSYLTTERVQNTPLDVFQAELAGKLAEVVVCVMDSYLRMLNVKDFSMYRGSAWVLWHIAKSELVLPRLRMLPIFADVLKNPAAYDIFCESRPYWMQHTDIQKALQ